jgi:hypothetical protein
MWNKSYYKGIKIIVWVVFILTPSLSFCQSDSSFLFKQRKKTVWITGMSSIAVTHIGLNQLWYKDHPKSSFHFINDNKEWLQVDKIGHTYSAYYLGLVGIEAARWAGYSEKKAIWIGGLYGTFFQTPIEIQDGLSARWGASLGDIGANSLGTFLAISQELKWGEQKVRMKFSFTPTHYADKRPGTLGKGLHQEFLKDYNGQTYWLSANVHSFTGLGPKWLNFAVGYGASGMLGGFDNKWEEDGVPITQYEHIERYRQFYIAPDVDFTKIKSNSALVKSFLIVLNSIKMPAPALEMSGGSMKFHWLKF